MSQLLENLSNALLVLRCVHVQDETGRGYLLAVDLVAPTRRARVIRALAVAGVLVVSAGIALPSMASAQSERGQGQAVGLLLLFAGGSGSHARRDAALSKPNPGVRASDEAKGKNINVKQVRPPAKNGTRIAKVVEDSQVSRH